MRRWWIAGLTLLSIPAFAATSLDIDSVAGLYTSAPPNRETVSGKANNVLEVVKLSPETAYVRTHLEFRTAICGFWGVMHVEGETLVGKGVGNSKCELRLHFSGGKVTFEDQDHACKEESCGAQGAFESEEFSARTKRPITYMKRLLASRQYHEAMQGRGK